jgi:predicted RNase H-like HicB family nuclease
VTWREKLLERLRSGGSDASIDFDDLRGLLLDLGFEERVRGSHHLFRKRGIQEAINLQRDGRHAKVYQVRQVRALLLRHGLARRARMHRYEIDITWSPDDELFVAEVPELAGCAAHGATPEAALAAAQEAIALWLEVARELGEPIPEPRGRSLRSA